MSKKKEKKREMTKSEQNLLEYKGFQKKYSELENNTETEEERLKRKKRERNKRRSIRRKLKAEKLKVKEELNKNISISKYTKVNVMSIYEANDLIYNDHKRKKKNFLQFKKKVVPYYRKNIKRCPTLITSGQGGAVPPLATDNQRVNV